MLEGIITIDYAAAKALCEDRKIGCLYWALSRSQLG
jgi:hypothetical protein